MAVNRISKKRFESEYKLMRGDIYMKIDKQTKSIHIDGQGGTWSVTDSVVIEGAPFFLLQNDKHGNRMENIVLDEEARLILDKNDDGFSPYVIQLIRQKTDLKSTAILEKRISVRDKLMRLHEEKRLE